MRWKIAALGIMLTIFFGVISEHRAQAQSAVSIDLFYQELSPHGGWSPHPEFGYIWQPYDVGPQWKPYADGRWEWSDQGWIWISYEPWGWATYHYGRWVFDDYQGWIWIPGTTWAPAWVSWQESPEYIGWSPLPPDRGFFIEIGFVFNSYKSYYKPYRYKHHHKHHYGHHHKKHRYYHDYYHDPHNYKPPRKHSVYMPYHKFGDHKHVASEVVPPKYARDIRNTRHVTNIKRVNNKVYNYGPDKYAIEKRSKRKLVRHKIVDKLSIQLRGKQNINYVKDKSYNAYRPKIDRVSKDPFTTNRGSNIKNGSRDRGTNNTYPNNRTKKANSLNAAQNYRGVEKKGVDQQKSGYNKYGYKNKQQNKYEKYNKSRTQNIRGNYNKPEPKNTYTTRQKHTQRNNHYNKSQYNRKDKSLKSSNYQAYRKSSKNNYSTKHDKSFTNRSQIPKTNSYKSKTKNIPTSQRNRFSKN